MASNESLHRLPLGVSRTAHMMSENDVTSRSVAPTSHTPDSTQLSPDHNPDFPSNSPSSDPSQISSDHTTSSDHTPDSSHTVLPTPLRSNRLRSAELRHSKPLAAAAPSSEATPSPDQGELQEDFNFSNPAPLVSTPISADADHRNESCDHLEATPTNRVVSCDLEATPTVNRLFGGVLGNQPTATHSPNLMTKICTEMARRSYHRRVLGAAGEERVNAEDKHMILAGDEGVKAGQSGMERKTGENCESIGVDNCVAEEKLCAGDTQGSLKGAKASDDEIMSSNVSVAGERQVDRGTMKRRRPAAADHSFSISSQGQMCFSNCSHYSATLGIDLVDLPRRKLRRCEEPLQQDGLAEEPRPLLDSRQHRPSSPVVHSASLGITQLRGAGNRRRGKKAGPKDTGLLNGSCDVTGTPPPPILKILEMNGVSRRNRSSKAESPRGNVDQSLNTTKAGETVSLPDTTDSDTTAGGQEPSGNIAPLKTTGLPMAFKTPLPPILGAPLKALGQRSAKPLSSFNLPPVVAEDTGPKPPHRQRHKSPWRWASMRNRHDYTPVKSKGIISK